MAIPIKLSSLNKATRVSHFVYFFPTMVLISLTLIRICGSAIMIWASALERTINGTLSWISIGTVFFRYTWRVTLMEYLHSPKYLRFHPALPFQCTSCHLTRTAGLTASPPHSSSWSMTLHSLGRVRKWIWPKLTSLSEELDN